MRTIQRDIAGGFIFSSEGKILLGYNKKGGVYQNQLVVPGGGVDEGETKLEALHREMLEETGIDIKDAVITQVEGVSRGESEKDVPETGERVLAKMSFYDFKIQLSVPCEDIDLVFEDDYADAAWYTAEELRAREDEIGPATKATLQRISFI